MKRTYMELLMGCLLLICFYFLAKEAAVTSVSVLEADAEYKKEKILIDPGHGGMDPGMIGIQGLEEKRFNLAISLKLKKQLEKDGYQVLMTRDSDQGLYDENSENKKAQDMQRRIALISTEQPILAVSIHQNSYEDPMVCGPQVFYYADSVNGEHLAEAVQRRLNEIPGVMRQREKKENTSYYILKRSPAVMILVECGFLTNPDEASLLQNDEYQEKIAEAIRFGILDYLNA